jgi:L-ascorbate metabolism protein UlaG (beta-lactamase superfamily)
MNELDWWQSLTTENGFTLTATPARHFSGRGLVRNKTLWTSYVLQTQQQIVFIGGDSGYDTHFKEIGEKFGPFDLAILECGQYDAYWPYIHMMPEETVQAAIDLRANILLPVHWAKFALSAHAWDEPIKRLVQAAATQSLTVATPMIGEQLTLHEPLPQKHWWTAIAGTTSPDAVQKESQH